MTDDDKRAQVELVLRLSARIAAIYRANGAARVAGQYDAMAAAVGDQ